MSVRAGMASESFPTRELVFRARGGDLSAVETLYARYLPILQRWARGRMPRQARDLNDTGDLVQETLVKALRRLETVEVERPGAFFAYLRAALMNRIRDEARRVGRRPPGQSLEEAHPTLEPSPLEELVGRETLDRFERAMETLTPEYREAVMVRMELNLSYAEIAEILGKQSPDAARMTVARALAKLATAMAA